MTQRTALVTGANRGIGRAIAEGLARERLTVIVCGRDEDGLIAVADQLNQDGTATARALVMDVADPGSIDRALGELAGDGVSVDVLINNAGILPDGDMLTMPWEDIEASTRVNGLGPLQLMRALMPGMVARGYGRVVNVSSGWGSLNSLGPGAYGITKAFLNAITIKGAREAPGNVLVNAMCPGWVKTSMGGSGADRSPEEGADTALYLATLPENAISGELFRDRRPIPWDE